MLSRGRSRRPHWTEVLGELSPSPTAGQTQDHGRPGAGSTEAAGLRTTETSGTAMGDRERNKKRLLELLQAAGTGNAHCADCGAAGKGKACGAGAARHGPGPWLVGPFPRSPSTRDPASFLAWEPQSLSTERLRRPRRSSASLLSKAGTSVLALHQMPSTPCSLSLSHWASYYPGHHLRPWALPAPSDPEVLTSDAS